MENPIDPEKTTQTPGLIAFPHSVGSAVIKPEDLGKMKGRALNAMKDQTERQLSQLYTQMQTLVEQANNLKLRVEVSENIYKSHIPFEPVIGHEYYMYERENGSHFLSMISPKEWGKSTANRKCNASVTLLSDHTWEVKNM